MTTTQSTQGTHSPVHPIPAAPVSQVDFDQWATLVRQQMIASLQKRGSTP